MGETPESVQPPQPLRERPDAASLRHQIFRIDVSPHLEGLRRHHDQVMLAPCVRWPSRRHPVFRVEYPGPGPRRVAFACEPCKEQGLRFRQRLAQAPERVACGLWRVAEHKACSRSGRLPNESNGSLREWFRRLAVCDLNLKRLRGAQPPTDNRVRLVVVVQIEPFALCGVPGRGQ